MKQKKNTPMLNRTKDNHKAERKQKWSREEIVIPQIIPPNKPDFVTFSNFNTVTAFDLTVLFLFLWFKLELQSSIRFILQPWGLVQISCGDKQDESHKT